MYIHFVKNVKSTVTLLFVSCQLEVGKICQLMCLVVIIEQRMTLLVGVVEYLVTIP